MSSLSSTVNSLSAVTIEDYIKRFRGDLSEEKYVRYSRLLSVFWGLVCLFFAFFAGSIEGTVIEVINKVSSVFFGPILAAFVLAILTKKTHALAANVGIIAGVGLNIYLWLYVPEVFWFWWNAIGCVVTILVALLLTALIPARSSNEAAQVEVVFYPAKKEVALLLVYFLIIVAVALAVPYWLSA
ncbi:MAG: sodium transporter, partial [Phaeodactylibacter sp.]|nr:sodium transporter [Phaeodactylibacter sp.]